jgi:hypothetical protein
VDGEARFNFFHANMLQYRDFFTCSTPMGLARITQRILAGGLMRQIKSAESELELDSGDNTLLIFFGKLL